MLASILTVVVAAQVRVKGVETKGKEKPLVKPIQSIELGRHKNALVECH